MKAPRKIEFFIVANGELMATYDNQPPKIFSETDRETTAVLLLAIQRQYPSAFDALSKNYAKYKRNRGHFEFLCVHRFLRCNFGKVDHLTWDFEEGVLNIEDTHCPLKWGNDCPLKGVVCNPLPFGLTPRETEIARLTSAGITYKEISQRLGIAHSTIRNTIQRIAKKLHLSSSKDITRFFLATLSAYQT